MPEGKPSLVARAAAGLLSYLEKKAAPALTMRHSRSGGGPASGAAWWGDVRGPITIGAMPGDDRDLVADAGDIWLNSAVSACLSWLMDQCSEPEFRVTALDRERKVYTPFGTHGLVDRIETPNDSYDADALWAATVLSWQVSGEAFWLKVRNRARTEVLELWFCPSWEIAPVWPDDGSAFITGYVHSPDGEAREIPVEDVVHFRRGLNPNNLRAGLSPLGAVLREIATDNAAQAYEAAILRNMGIVPTWIQPAEAGDQFAAGEPEVIEQQFQAKTTGSTRGRAVVSDARVDIKQFGLGPKDMTLGSVRYIPEDRICAATGVNAMVVGLSSGSIHKTYNNLSEATRAAYNRGLIPMQRGFARALTRQLLWADYGGRPGVDYCEWNYDEVAALSEDADAKAARAALLFEKRVIKRGKACEMIGVECEPEFDTYLEQPSVENARAWAAVDDNPETDPDAMERDRTARLFGKPRAAAPSRLTPGGDDDEEEEETPPKLRIAKALAAAAASGKASADGHASPEREDGIDPFLRIVGQVKALAAGTPTAREAKAADPAAAPGWGEDDEDDEGEDEANTYNLPTGRPIAAELRRWFEAQAKDVLGTVRTIGAGLGDPAAWAALPPVPVGLGAYDAPMAEAMTPLIGAYWDESGRRTMAKVGLDPDDWRVVDPNTRRMIETAALAFSRSTNETTSKDLRTALDLLREELAAGIVERGEALPQLTRRIMGVFETASKQRARVIAETEASRAVHQAQMESARKSGVVWGKKLLLSSDACEEICQPTKASEPEYGWPLDAEMRNDGRGHPVYSSIVSLPLHPRCRCTFQLVTYDEAPPDVVRPDYGSIFDDVPEEEQQPAAVAETEAPAPPPPGPLGRPVGDALTLPKGEMGKRLRTTIEAIAKVHGDGELPVIPVEKNASNKANGAYERTQDGTAVRIAISSKGQRPEETFAHEIGHFLEKTAIPGHVRGYRNWKADPLFASWVAAINDSSATKNLRDLAGKVTVDRVTADGRAVKYKVDGRYLVYGLSPEELWARSYSQYIATRSGDPALMKGIDWQRDPDRLYRDFQWSDEDFTPIAAAIDELFKVLGWLG